MKKPGYYFFWESTDPFSQWYPSKFKKNGMTFFNAEQYMMYQKAILFGDEKTAELIMIAKTPKRIKYLGRQVKNFDEFVWRNNREIIVYNGNLLKFSQNNHLKSYMLATGNNILVEASPYDKIWGIGLSKNDHDAKHPNKWKGQNLLGKCLMYVRDTLNN